MARPKQPYRAPIGRRLRRARKRPTTSRELLSAGAPATQPASSTRAPCPRVVAKFEANGAAGVSETDEMALVGAISTMLLHERLVAKSARSRPPLEPTRVVVGATVRPPSPELARRRGRLMRTRPQRLLHDSLLASAADDLADKAAIVDEYGAAARTRSCSTTRSRLARALAGRRGSSAAIASRSSRQHRGVLRLRSSGRCSPAACSWSSTRRRRRTSSRSSSTTARRAFLLTEAASRGHRRRRASRRRRRARARVFSTRSADGAERSSATSARRSTRPSPTRPTPGTIPLDLAALDLHLGQHRRAEGRDADATQALVFAAGASPSTCGLERGRPDPQRPAARVHYGLSQLLLAVPARRDARCSSARSPSRRRRSSGCATEEVTVFPAVPTVYATLLGMKGERDLPERHAA